MNQQIAMDTSARFLWHDPDGALCVGMGRPRNISRHRVSIFTDSLPSVGEEVQIIVDIPSPGPDSGTVPRAGKGVAVLVEGNESNQTRFTQPRSCSRTVGKTLKQA